MNRIRYSALLLVLILGAAACEKQTPEPVDTTEALVAAEAAVNARAAAMGTATQAGDVQGLLDVWAADVRIIESGVVMDGEEQAGAMMQGFLGGFNVSNLVLNPTETVAHDGGTVVYQYGYLTQTLTPKQGGPNIPVRNNFAFRWTQDANGTWEMHRYVATAAPQDPPSVPLVTPVRSAAGELAATGGLAAGDVVAEIAQRTNEYADALKSGDAARTMSFFTDDVQFIEPEMQFVGKPSLDEFMKQVHTTHRVEDLQMQPTETFVHDYGSVAYQFGGYTEIVVASDGKQPATTTRNNYLVRWRRGAEGTWLIDRFTSTAQPDGSRR